MTKLAIISLLSVILLPACSAKQLNLIKVENSTERKEIIGLSLLPPQGDDWYYEKVHPARIMFGKKNNNKFQSFVVLAVCHKINDINPDNEENFLNMISEQRWRHKTTRFKIVLNEEKITHEREEMCVRYHTIMEDHSSKYTTKENPYLVVDDIGLVCRHPDNKNIGITFGISKRDLPEASPGNYEKEANEYLANAKFIPLPKE